jgi:hypothetical protein
LLDVIPKLDKYEPRIWNQVEQLLQTKQDAVPQLAFVCSKVRQALSTTKHKLEQKQQNLNTNNHPSTTQNNKGRGDPQQRKRNQGIQKTKQNLLALYKRQLDSQNTQFTQQREYLLSPLPRTLPPEPSIIGVGLLKEDLPEELRSLIKEGVRRKIVRPTPVPQQSLAETVQTQFLSNVKKAEKKRAHETEKEEDGKETKKKRQRVTKNNKPKSCKKRSPKSSKTTTTKNRAQKRSISQITTKTKQPQIKRTKTHSASTTTEPNTSIPSLPHSPQPKKVPFLICVVCIFFFNINLY